MLLGSHGKESLFFIGSQSAFLVVEQVDLNRGQNIRNGRFVQIDMNQKESFPSVSSAKSYLSAGIQTPSSSSTQSCMTSI